MPDGEMTSFPKAVQCQDNETVVFSWVVWPSKEVRDAAVEKMHHDKDMEDMASNMPFDGKRMIYGGFQMVLDE